MGLLGDLVVRIVGDTADFVRSVEQSGRRMSKFERDMKRITRSMERTGRQLSRFITLPIAAIGAISIKTAADFETSMNRVRAVSGASGEAFEALERTARELGETTQFSAAEAADAMGFLAMAGFEANKIIGAMPGTLNLAASAQLEMGQAADIVSNVMSAFQLDAEELEGAVDVLAKTFTSSNTDLTQLGEAMSYVAPISNALGVSIEETSAAIGILGNAGIQGSAAGTGLRKVLTTLIQESDRLGIATTDASGNLLPLATLLDKLRESGISTAKTLEVFGQRAGPAIQVLLAAGGDALRDFTGELENAGGTAQRIADIQMEGFNGTLRRFKSVAQEAGITIGNVLLPRVTELLETIQKWIRAFNDLSAGAQKTILIIAGLAAAAGPLLIVLSKLPATIKGIKAALALLAAPPTGAIILAVTAVAALTVAIVHLIRRKREYERLVYDTANAVRALSDEEQRAARQRLIEERLEAYNELRDAERRLIVQEERLAEAQENQRQGRAVDRRQLHGIQMGMDALTDEVDEHRTKVNDLTTAINEINDVRADQRAALEADQEAFDETTLSAADLLDGIGELEDGTDDLTQSVIDLTESLQGLSGVIHHAGFTIGEDFLPVFGETFRPDSKWAKDAKATIVSIYEAYQTARIDAVAIALQQEQALRDAHLANEIAAYTAHRNALNQIQFDGLEEAAQINDDSRDEELQKEAAFRRSMYNMIMGFANQLASLSNALADRRIANIEATGQAEEIIAEQSIRIQQRAARFEKAVAAFAAIIDTARAIIGFMADPGGPAGVGLSIAAGAVGAAQLATILAQPIPQPGGGIGAGSTPSGGIGGGGTPAIDATIGARIGGLPLDRPPGRPMANEAMEVVVNLDGKPILEYMGKASRDRRLLIDAKAVV